MQFQELSDMLYLKIRCCSVRISFVKAVKHCIIPAELPSEFIHEETVQHFHSLKKEILQQEIYKGIIKYIK